LYLRGKRTEELTGARISHGRVFCRVFTEFALLLVVNVASTMAKGRALSRWIGSSDSLVEPRFLTNQFTAEIASGSAVFDRVRTSMPEPEPQLTDVAAKLGIGRYHKHVFLCTGPNCCAPEDGQAAWETLKQQIKDQGLASGLQACYRTKVGCLRICCHGPTMLVYPDGTWYSGMTSARIPEFVRRHLLEGQPAEEWIFARNSLGQPEQHSVPGFASWPIAQAEHRPSAGKLDLASRLFEETLKLQKAKLGPEHPNTLNSMFSLASAYDEVKQFDKAELLFQE
jgi:(2Fe-2S) ferredoxin